jgi:hypothetical protein
MSKIDTDVLKAFTSVGVPSEVAEKAAAALHKRDDDLAVMKTDISVLKWMMGVSLTLSVAILGKLLVH